MSKVWYVIDGQPAPRSHGCLANNVGPGPSTSEKPGGLHCHQVFTAPIYNLDVSVGESAYRSLPRNFSLTTCPTEASKQALASA
jgi:hypothetical protein